MELNLTDCFQLMAKYKASDLHLKVGSPPLVRKNKQLLRLYKKYNNLSQETIKTAIEFFLKEHQIQKLQKEKQLDFSIGVPEIGRFRLNIFYQRGTLRVVARNIPFEIPTFDSLNLPKVVKDIVSNIDEKGLILITGSTGSGKSSTIISMINHINNNYNKHIITIEDPIEFLIKDQKSLITQRELGVDFLDYNSALRSTLRQDPDIIFFGELRDFSSMETTLTAANTGHLVFSTLHTNNVTDTINRVLSMVNPDNKKLFRMEFASSLKAIICQKLLVKKDGSGLIPAIEILINNPRIRKELEDESKSTSNLQTIIEESKEGWGMQSFNQHLIELVDQDLISKEVALQNSPSPEKLTLHFSGLNNQNREDQKSMLQTNIQKEDNNIALFKINIKQ